MLQDKVILYDDSCPMCKLYTYWFVVGGLLAPENRIGFSSVSPSISSRIDLNRGRHEIPLYDRSTHETLYGLDALTSILRSRWEWLRPVFESKPFHWFFHPLYEIITYNRRVISGCQTCTGFDCAPDLNRFYRSVYLGILGSLVLAMSIGLVNGISIFGWLGAGLIMIFSIGGVVYSSLLRILRGSLEAWNGAGNIGTTIFIVALSLTPLVLIPTMLAGFAGANLGMALCLGVTEIRRRGLV